MEDKADRVSSVNVSAYENDKICDLKTINESKYDNLSDTVFVAGNIKNHLETWKQITDDKHILETVSGCRIDLDETPYQSFIPKPLSVSDSEEKIIDNEIDIMLREL